MTARRLLGVVFFLTLSVRAHALEPNRANLDIPPRNQWEANYGYCGEVSLISAGLYYGQYVSQYDARRIASPGVDQSRENSQLLVGINDREAASRMHLSYLAWDTDQQSGTDDFLAWTKQMIVKGYPVILGVYMNYIRFYGHPGGDSDYDHIVPAIGIVSHHPLSDPTYYADDVIRFSDNGLWTPDDKPVYLFDFPFGNFQASRSVANEAAGAPYRLPDSGRNFGLAVTGVADRNGDTLPVRLQTDRNDEPAIADGSNRRPRAVRLRLTVTVSGLRPGVRYRLYRYDDFADVPDSDFNANADRAAKHWEIQIESGHTYVTSESISSDQMAIYRAVEATAP